MMTAAASDGDASAGGAALAFGKIGKERKIDRAGAASEGKKGQGEGEVDSMSTGQNTRAVVDAKTHGSSHMPSTDVRNSLASESKGGGRGNDERTPKKKKTGTYKEDEEDSLPRGHIPDDAWPEEYEKLKPLEETLKVLKAISNPPTPIVKDIEDKEKTLSSFKGKNFQMKIVQKH